MTTAKTTVNLNLRQGPGTNFPVLALLPPDTVCEVLGPAGQGDWLNIRLAGLEGWVHRSFVLLDTQGVAPGFINDQPGGADPAGLAPLAPSRKIVLGTPASGLERQAANAWNKYGGLLQALSDKLRIDPGAAVAVLAIESGGRGFAADGRMIIRFENHLFFDQWGNSRLDAFGQHFAYNPDKRWLDHRWRPDDGPWREFHGSQDGEWEVFGFARGLDDTAAKLSISMGGPQIVGFNYPTLGYESVGQMYDAFTSDERNQIVGFFDFVQGPGSNSRRVLALQARDFTTFAALYNGPGQAAKYGSLIQGLFDTFERIKPA
jgi:uncharacterized protein YraI